MPDDKDKVEKAKGITPAAEPKTDPQDAKTLHTISMGPDYKGPGQISVALPGGFKKQMNVLQKDRSEPDYPMAEAKLTPKLVRHYKSYGFTVTPK
jgi:hypothetical protein